MSGEKITDPEILSQIPGMQADAPSPSVSDSGMVINDPEILKQINSPKAAAPQEENSLIPPEERAMLSEVGAAGVHSGAWTGFTGGLGSVLESAVATPFTYIQRKSEGKDTSFAKEYWRNLEALRIMQKGYERANPLTAAASEAIGMYANPIGGALEGPGKVLGGAIASRVGTAIPSAWGGQAAARIAGMAGEAGLAGAGIGAEQALGQGYDFTPSQYVTAPLGGAVVGGALGAALAPPLAGIGAGLTYAGEKVVKPLTGAAGRLIANAVPEAPGKWLKGNSEEIAKSAATKDVADAMDEVSRTINERRAAKGQIPIDPLDKIRESILPPVLPPASGKGIKNIDNAEDVVSNIDAVSKLRVSGGRSGLTEARKRAVQEIMVSKRLSPEARIENINKLKYLSQTEKDSLTKAIQENPIDAKDRVDADNANSYFESFTNHQKIPTNLIDQTAQVAAASKSTGAENPMDKLARVAAGSGGAEKSALAAELGQRQAEQPLRMAKHIEEAAKSATPAGDFQNLDQARQTAEHLTSTVAKDAYGKVRQSRAPIDLTEKLAEYGRQRMGMTGEAGNALGKAIQEFRTVHHKESPYGLSPDEMSDIQATFKGHQFQPDVSRFIDARHTLDDMIKGAKGHAYQVLNQFRADMNEIARAAHPQLKVADQTFGEGKTIEKIIDKAFESSTKLNHSAEDTVKYFDSLIPEQKNLFRMSFAQKLKEIVESAPEKSAFVGGKFQNKATRDMINHIFGSVPGEVLNNAIASEASTTHTMYKAFGGSQTTPWRDAIEQFRLGAELPAHVMVHPLSPHGIWNTAANLLKTDIANRQATHIGRMIAQSDPIQKLKTINMLKQAKDQASQQAMNRRALRAERIQAFAPLLANAHTVGQDAQ